MSSGLDSLKQELNQACDKIAETFVRQCTHGAQSPWQGKAAACGQFLGQDVLTWQQRGLHGTAAALSVLARSDTPDARTTVPQLVQYLVDRKKYEVELADEADKQHGQYKCDFDGRNTIKVSECLLAITRVKSGLCDTGVHQKRLAEKLQKSLIDKKGWDYFLDTPNGRPELLPTAYATLALSAFGADARDARAFMVNKLMRAAGQPVRSADLAIRVLCLYSLQLSHAEGSADEAANLGGIAAGLWRQLEPLLAGAHEQNIGYRGDSETFYARIPWQLYLLFVAIRMGDWRRLATKAARVRLEEVIAGAREGGFVYPHSDIAPASRTNAVVYDLLSEFRNKLTGSAFWWLLVLRRFHWLRALLAHRCIKLVIAGLATVLILVSIWTGVKEESLSISALAPEFGGAALVYLALLGRRR